MTTEWSESHDPRDWCGYIVEWVNGDPKLCGLKPGHESDVHVAVQYWVRTDPVAAAKQMNALFEKYQPSSGERQP